LYIKHVSIAVALGLAAALLTYYIIYANMINVQDNTSNSKRLEYEVKRIMINDVMLEVEIADTDEKRALGLMHREELDEYKGMLFVFPYEGRYSFWMMNMNFSIDILWLNADGNVIYIVSNAKPCKEVSSVSECTYNPDVYAKYVLEVNSGFAERHGIVIGSKMTILD
jgi:uncharacterized membrane protein (UPF0127 family)